MVRGLAGAGRLSSFVLLLHPASKTGISRTAQLPSEMSPFASVPALLVPAVAWLGSEGSPEPTQDAEAGGQAVCLLANKC